MNTAELEASIARAGATKRSLAKRLGISEQAFYNKVNGETEFKSSEIKALAQELSLDLKAVNFIFFESCVN